MPFPKQILLLIGYFLLATTYSFSQENIPTVPIKVKTLTVDDGLSQGFVYGAIQDKDGFIWLATPDCKYSRNAIYDKLHVNSVSGAIQKANQHKLI